MGRRVSLAIVATAALSAASSAFAQTTWIEVEDGDVIVDIVVEPRAYTVDDLEDMQIVGGNGEEIGEVEEILRSTDGTRVALATDVGGFLGMGERDVVVPLEKVRVVGDVIVLDITKEQIEALEDWVE